MELKELRINKKLSQKQAAMICTMPLRTYQNYENQSFKMNSIKYKYLVDTLNEYNKIDEDHGVLSIEEISEKVSAILKPLPVKYCILFGSYARNEAEGRSDVDLIIDNSITGLDFFGLIEEIRESLNKRVDLLNISQLSKNTELTNNVLLEGRRIYVKKE